jgi:hypothetical protein
MPSPRLALATLLATLLAPGAHAYAYDIDDAWNGAASYWGHDRSRYADIIGSRTDGASEFEIQGADLGRTSEAGRTWLAVTLYTQFAGRADERMFASLTVGQRGIGYGDLFLASAWTPEASQPHYAADNARNGTHWAYAFVLDDRWDADGGAGALYTLAPADPVSGHHNPGALLSQDFMTGGVYRKGQPVAARPAGPALSLGEWAVADREYLRFEIDVTGTLLASSEAIALHWGMTCANDVIQGVKALPLPPVEVSGVPEPGTAALLALGLGAIARARRRRAH